MLKSRKGIHRKTKTQRSTQRSTRRSTRRSKRRSTYCNKRIICNRIKQNRTKGGDYTDPTITERELVPLKSKGVVVAMPGYVFSAKEYVDHMEYMDRQGSP